MMKQDIEYRKIPVLPVEIILYWAALFTQAI